MPKTRVLIIDDAVVVRRLVSDCLAQDPNIEVVGTAPDGQIGLAKIEQLNPDLVTLDIEMPVLDGLQTLAAIRKKYLRLPVIMFSTLTERGASATIDALELGASDYVTKPTNVGSVGVAMQRVREQLIPKIKALCRQAPARPGIVMPSAAAGGGRGLSARPGPLGAVDVVAIGVSTGGPNALATVFPALAKDFPVPIVMVQHMPPMFTRLLAERLEVISPVRVREGEAGALVRPGEAWVAPGGFHLEVERTSTGVLLRLHNGPPENSCCPAVDVLFRSVARVYGPRVLSIVLTGMGQDGLRGCECVREAGGQVIVQDEASSVVWGMPRAVTEAGLADQILPLSEIAGEINRRVQAGVSASAPTPVAPVRQPTLPRAS